MNKELPDHFQQQCEQNLLRLPNLLSTLLSSADLGYWFLEQENGAQAKFSINESLRAMIGYESLVTQYSFADFCQNIVKSDLPQLAKAIKTPSAWPDCHRLNIRFRHHYGHTMHLRFELHAISQGENPTIMAVVRDITSEVRLQHTDKLLGSAMQAVSIGLVILNKDLNFSDLNDACSAILGYPREQLLKETLIKLIVPAHQELVALELSALIEQKTIKAELEVPFQHLDGHHVVAQLTVQPVYNQQDKLVNLVCSIRSIQETKDLIEELEKHNKQLASLNHELEQFAYIASHDLRAPLNGIRQLVSWIEEDSLDALPENSVRHLGLVKNRSDRMLRLLDDLLAYARIGTKEYGIEEIDSQEIVNNLKVLTAFPENFKISCNKKDLRIQRVLFELVIRNLVSNSVKHHDKQAGEVTIRIDEEDDIYIIEVEDDGPGIALEFHQKALAMFQTLKPRDQVEGSGVGLALVKKAVDLLNGSINIISDGVRGTTVAIVWPKPK